MRQDFFLKYTLLAKEDFRKNPKGYGLALLFLNGFFVGQIKRTKYIQ